MRLKEFLNEARNVKRFVFEDESTKKRFEKELKKLKVKYDVYSKFAITVDMDMIKVQPDKTKVLSLADQMNAKIEDSMK